MGFSSRAPAPVVLLLLLLVVFVSAACGGDNFVFVRKFASDEYRLFFKYERVRAELGRVDAERGSWGQWRMMEEDGSGGDGAVLLTADLSAADATVLSCSLVTDRLTVDQFRADFDQQTKDQPNGDTEPTAVTTTTTNNNNNNSSSSSNNSSSSSNSYSSTGEEMGHSVFHRLREAPNGYENLLNWSWMLRQCERLSSANSSLASPSPSQFGHNQLTGSRLKRHTGSSSSMIFPGTKWCGDGSEATSRSDHGPLAYLDRCCRHHDHCPLSILAMTSRFRLFNYFLFTMSHCSCDRRFHTCLKMTNSGAANVIGNIFFNVVRTRCFVLKRKRVCDNWSWLQQKCISYGVVKQAYLQQPIPY